MKLTLVRHAQTDWNKIKKLQGGLTDNLLDEVGLSQAIRTSQKLKENYFDIIVTSPMLRAKQTANEINKNHKKNIIEDKRITERLYGKLEGSDYNKYKENMRKIHNDDSYELFEIERVEDLQKRVKEFWDEFFKEHFGKNVLIVSHSGTLKVLLSFILDKSLKEIRETYYKSNASISTIEFDENKKIKNIIIGDDKHLID